MLRKWRERHEDIRATLRSLLIHHVGPARSEEAKQCLLNHFPDAFAGYIAIERPSFVALLFAGEAPSHEA